MEGRNVQVAGEGGLIYLESVQDLQKSCRQTPKICNLTRGELYTRQPWGSWESRMLINLLLNYSNHFFFFFDSR